MSANVHHLDKEQALDAIRALLLSLAPRASAFLIYGSEHQVLWRSERCDEDEVDVFVADIVPVTNSASKTGAERRTLESGRTALAIPVCARNGMRLGTLVALFSRNAGKSSGFDPNVLSQVLAPAASLVAELLRLTERLTSAEDAQAATDEELSLVYLVDKKLHAQSRRHSGLAELVGQSARFMGVAYSVLLVPSKRVRVSATHSSWKAVNRRAVDKYTVNSLFPQIDASAGPVVFDIASIEDSDHPSDQQHQALLGPLVNAEGGLEGVFAQFARVNGKPFDDSDKRFMEHIVRKAEYVIEQSFDLMTGLMNRRGFEVQLQETGKSLVEGKNPHQLIYFDIDNLQLVNDTFGRDAGDAVLLRLAHLIETFMPSNAVATRLTGDDFVVLVTHAETDRAMDLAKSVRAQSHQLRYLEGSKSLQVTVSIGIAEFSDPDADGAALTAARIACDAAKDHGRDRIEVHDQGDQSIIRRYDDMHLVANIQQTLDKDEFTLVAQPIVHANEPSKAAGYEVLIRMQDGKGSPIAASTLISAAERYHMMPQVDRWVISSAIQMISPHASELERAGISFALNLSGQTLGDGEMLAFIEEEIDASSVPPGLLCFEITESAAVSNMQKAQVFIARLRERGCRFSLDDFGVGLSSFAYLKSLEVDTVKIDGSFIRGIVDDKIAQSMVAAIAQVAKVMELKTVAEYVEDSATQSLLNDLGVHYLQGHGFGRPAELSGVIASVVGARKIA